MKKIAKQTVCLAIITCLALPLYAQDEDWAGSQNETKSGQRDEKPSAPSISITKEGSLPLGQLAGKKVSVAFKNSSKLAEALADRVTHLGGQAVQSDEEADVRLTGEGVYIAARELRNRQARADVGDVFENGGRVKTKTKSLDIVVSPGGPVLSAGQATVLANFAAMVGEVTGFGDWFNNLIAGDPDGFCYKGCEYRQSATINLEMRGRDGAHIGAASATASTENRKLMPLQLIEAALAEMLRESGDSQPKTSEAETRH